MIIRRFYADKTHNEVERHINVPANFDDDLFDALFMLKAQVRTNEHGITEGYAFIMDDAYLVDAVKVTKDGTDMASHMQVVMSYWYESEHLMERPCA